MTSLAHRLAELTAIYEKLDRIGITRATFPDVFDRLRLHTNAYLQTGASWAGSIAIPEIERVMYVRIDDDCRVTLKHAPGKS